MLEYVKGDFFAAQEDYLLCIASCTADKHDRREPLTTEIFKRFPEADIYKARKIDGSKGSPGSLIVRGKVAVLLSTFYPGSKPYPNDSQDKRLNWFAQGLKRLCTQYKPTTIAIRERFCEDSGGDWNSYVRVMDDLTRNLALANQTVTFRIYKYVEVIPLFSLVRYRDSVTPDPTPSPASVAVPAPASSPAPVTVSAPASLAPVTVSAPAPVAVPAPASSPAPVAVPAPASSPAPVAVPAPASAPVTVSAPTPFTVSALASAPASAPASKAAPSLPKLLKISVLAAPATQTPTSVSPVPSTQYPIYGDNLHWKGPLRLVPIAGWEDIMSDPTLVSELQKIDTFFETKEMPIFGNHIKIFPPQNLIFNAFNLCPFDKARVVIVGQDPYHSKVGEAMGLSFSVPRDIKVPSSLQNIYKELLTDIPGWQKPNHGDLTHWAEQGVLLINSALTVRQGSPKAHLDLWKRFTDRILTMISKRKKNLVFILWGGFAKQKQNILKNVEEHCIITGVHPSGLSANRGFFGSKPFSQTNDYLRTKGLPEIKW